MLKLLTIVNPVSGGVDKQPAIDYIKSQCENFGIDLELYETTGENDKKAIIERIATFGPDKIASVGGDGTTLFVATILKDFSIPMGIVPMGSANGLALELGVKEDFKAAFNEIIMSSMTCALDMIKVNGEHYAIHIGDVGLNANIIKGYEEDNGRGMLAYAKQFFKSLGNNKLLPVRIESGDEVFEEQGYMVAVANSRKYGTGVVLNKSGNPLDGYFEIIVLKEINITYVLQAGLSALNDTFASDENLLTIKCKKAKLIFEQEEELQLDGELIGTFKEVTLEMVPEAVQLITTKDNPFLA